MKLIPALMKTLTNIANLPKCKKGRKNIDWKRVHCQYTYWAKYNKLKENAAGTLYERSQNQLTNRYKRIQNSSIKN